MNEKLFTSIIKMKVFLLFQESRDLQAVHVHKVALYNCVLDIYQQIFDMIHSRTLEVQVFLFIKMPFINSKYNYHLLIVYPKDFLLIKFQQQDNLNSKHLIFYLSLNPMLQEPSRQVYH